MAQALSRLQKNHERGNLNKHAQWAKEWASHLLTEL